MAETIFHKSQTKPDTVKQIMFISPCIKIQSWHSDMVKDVI